MLWTIYWIWINLTVYRNKGNNIQSVHVSNKSICLACLCVNEWRSFILYTNSLHVTLTDFCILIYEDMNTWTSVSRAALRVT